MPVLFISKRDRLDLDFDPDLSQLDLGPTILGFAGTPQFWGAVGKSMLRGEDKRYYGIYGGKILVASSGDEKTIDMNDPPVEQDEALVRLFSTVFTR